jgi:preprotein translocase subunit SecA
VRDKDLKIDEKLRLVTLTEEGTDRVEQTLKLDNLYAPENNDLTHYLEQALKAQFIFHRDRDYVLVKDSQVLDGHQHRPDAEVVIVDEFTGRLMYGRRYSEGLHQAIEAKENVKIQRENQTLATITFQNYFRMYKKLAGMTGTAATEKEEFHQIYRLDVLPIPTNRPMVRQDQADLVYKDEDAKYRAVVAEIEDMSKQGRPVLVGTVSIERSEHIAEMLKRRGVKHQVLNAKYHEQEAVVIAQAGRPGAVTIATNMAGRGVDILLGGNPTGMVPEFLKQIGASDDEPTPEQLEAARVLAEKACAADRERVLSMGGLHILGTERHEARRIDNQLRGRAGRQGDPGSSRFFVSLNDELMRRFGGNSIAGLMERFGLEDDVPIEHGLVSKSIENAQTKVEGHNFDIRKHVVQYDDVMNKHREVIYGERKKILSRESLKDNVLDTVHAEIAELVETYTQSSDQDEWDLESLAQSLKMFLPVPPDFGSDDLEGFSKDELRERLQLLADQLYDAKEEALGLQDMRKLERMVMLNVINRLWVQHLTALDELREGIGLRAYGQRDPLVEYRSEAYSMFNGLQAGIQHEVAQSIFHLTIQRAPVAPKPQQIHTNRDDESLPPAQARAKSTKVGRNDACPCGSGKKYKKCCGRAV